MYKRTRAQKQASTFFGKGESTNAIGTIWYSQSMRSQSLNAMRLAVAKVENDRWDEDIQVEVILVTTLPKECHT